MMTYYNLFFLPNYIRRMPFYFILLTFGSIRWSKIYTTCIPTNYHISSVGVKIIVLYQVLCIIFPFQIIYAMTVVFWYINSNNQFDWLQLATQCNVGDKKMGWRQPTRRKPGCCRRITLNFGPNASVLHYHSPRSRIGPTGPTHMGACSCVTRHNERVFFYIFQNRPATPQLGGRGTKM